MRQPWAKNKQQDTTQTKNNELPQDEWGTKVRSLVCQNSHSRENQA